MHLWTPKYSPSPREPGADFSISTYGQETPHKMGFQKRAFTAGLGVWSVKVEHDPLTTWANDAAAQYAELDPSLQIALTLLTDYYVDNNLTNNNNNISTSMVNASNAFMFVHFEEPYYSTNCDGSISHQTRHYRAMPQGLAWWTTVNSIIIP